MLQTRLIRYVVTGALATLLYVVSVFTLVSVLQLPPVGANTIAYVITVLFSFTLNTKWSFSTNFSHAVFWKFCAVSMCGACLAAAISAAVQHLGMHYWYGVILIVCISPPLTFFLHRAWTYK